MSMLIRSVTDRRKTAEVTSDFSSRSQSEKALSSLSLPCFQEISAGKSNSQY